jgi:hypothetical protein
MPLALQTFRRKDTAALIVAFRANLAMGHEAGLDDAPLRHTVHRTLSGVQVEIRDATPVPGDRAVTLVVPPSLSEAEVALLRGMRNGAHGGPVVVWENGQTPPLDVVVVDVRTKAGAGALRFAAEVVLQPM